jgi:hypothetical protein
VHRDSIEIQADYDAHIPPTSSPGQYRDSIEIQAEYDAQIPPRLDRLHDCTPAQSTTKPNMSFKSRQDFKTSPSISKRLLSAISRLHSHKIASHFSTLLSTTLPKPFSPRFFDSKPTSIHNGRLA